jgi:hypothetical protein
MPPTKKTNARAKKTTTKKTTTKKTTAKKTTTKAKSKVITVTDELNESLKKLQDELTKKMGGKITYNMVIQSLIQEHIDLQNVKIELAEIQAEADKTQELIKELLKTAISNNQNLLSVGHPAQPQVQPLVVTYAHPAGMPGMYPPMMPGYPGSMPVPPSPPPSGPPKAPPPRKEYMPPPNTANIKSDYQKEINAVLSGEIMKPSDILKITKPKHAEVEVKALSDDEIAAKQPTAFFAETNPDHFKKTEEEKSQS